MNQPYGGQFPGGQPPYGAQPGPYGAPPPGYPQQQLAQPGYPAQPGMMPQPGMPPTGGYPAQPGYPGAPQQPGYPPQAGFGRILVQSSYFFMAWRLSSVPMTVFVDGQPQQMRWGQTFIDVPAGQHQIAIQGDYRGRLIGQAQTIAQVMPGQQTMLYYRAPAAASAPGSVGMDPQQPTNGIGLTLGICGAIILIGLIPLIIALAA
ncbi:MAG TPA: hypothetical protein VJ914_21990 [Pseudonocardiaceae bacterium]|nr:hypothetical protein [Pseudonocardiaceae bacterium]